MSRNPQHHTMTSAKPGGILRWGLRLPIWLYKIGLGWLLGGRFLLLVHTGRVSGLPRQAVIEVMRHDQVSDAYFVASGWGRKSDWYQNIRKNPQVTIKAGRRSLPAHAELLDEVASAQELYRYAQAHPLAFKELSRMMSGERQEGSLENCRELAKTIPVVVFKIDKTS
jgi:deazaflavin-dependent oxidoreductase (nitroreductase family)